MKREEIKIQLAQLIQEHSPGVDVEEITEKTRLEEDLQMGSLEMFELTMAIEENFDFAFDDSEQDELMSATVGDLVTVILKKSA
ncbi:acyl carrier protein [bacterium]|nr:acyl carrier protein [bacterium]